MKRSATYLFALIFAVMLSLVPSEANATAYCGDWHYRGPIYSPSGQICSIWWRVCYNLDQQTYEEIVQCGGY